MVISGIWKMSTGERGDGSARSESKLVNKLQGQTTIPFGVLPPTGEKSLIKSYKVTCKFTAARPLISRKR